MSPAIRTQLWNSVEAVEKRKDAQLAQEVEVALPNDLTLKEQRELLAGWVDEHYTQKGFVADVNIHRAPIGAVNNDHAHVMTTLRGIDPETGDWKKKKDRQESKSAFQDARGSDIEQLRASWAAHVNSALEKAGIDGQQVDHRSHKRRGITDVQPGIHVGYAAQGIEKRGGHSWRASLNRQIRQTNQRILADIKAKAVATYRAFTKGLAQKLAADAIGPELTPATQTPAPKKPEPEPTRQAAKPEPTRLREMLPLMRPDKLGLELTPAEPTLAPKPVLKWPLKEPDKLAGGPEPILAPKPVLQPPPMMRPDKVPGGAAYTAPIPAPKPVLQPPPPMRPDKVAPVLQPAQMRPDKLGLELTPAEPILAPKKPEPMPAPIEAKPQPVLQPKMPPPAILDAEAEKRKKAAHLAAFLQQGGGRGGP